MDLSTATPAAEKRELSTSLVLEQPWSGTSYEDLRVKDSAGKLQQLDLDTALKAADPEGNLKLGRLGSAVIAVALDTLFKRQDELGVKMPEAVSFNGINAFIFARGNGASRRIATGSFAEILQLLNETAWSAAKATAAPLAEVKLPAVPLSAEQGEATAADPKKIRIAIPAGGAEPVKPESVAAKDPGPVVRIPLVSQTPIEPVVRIKPAVQEPAESKPSADPAAPQSAEPAPLENSPKAVDTPAEEPRLPAAQPVIVVQPPKEALRLTIAGASSAPASTVKEFTLHDGDEFVSNGDDGRPKANGNRRSIKVRRQGDELLVDIFRNGELEQGAVPFKLALEGFKDAVESGRVTRMPLPV